jgi:hypothetical protein
MRKCKSIVWPRRFAANPAAGRSRGIDAGRSPSETSAVGISTQRTPFSVFGGLYAPASHARVTEIAPFVAWRCRDLHNGAALTERGLSSECLSRRRDQTTGYTYLRVISRITFSPMTSRTSSRLI